MRLDRAGLIGQTIPPPSKTKTLGRKTILAIGLWCDEPSDLRGITFFFIFVFVSLLNVLTYVSADCLNIVLSIKFQLKWWLNLLTKMVSDIKRKLCSGLV